MQDIVHKALVADINATIQAAGMSKASFGQDAVNDPRLVYDLEKGRELRSTTLRRIQATLNALKERLGSAA